MDWHKGNQCRTCRSGGCRCGLWQGSTSTAASASSSASHLRTRARASSDVGDWKRGKAEEVSAERPQKVNEAIEPASMKTRSIDSAAIRPAVQELIQRLSNQSSQLASSSYFPFVSFPNKSLRLSSLNNKLIPLLVVF